MSWPRIGIFGGTFDPVHLGHLIAAADLAHALRLDRTVFMPAGRPPHKDAALVGDDDHRLAMLRLALSDNPAFEISTIDLERDGPSYTADLLDLLADREPDAELVFLMGEDSLRDLPTWHQPERILRRAEIGVALRPGVGTDLDSLYARLPTARGRISVVPTPLIGVSSTDIRRRVAAGEPIRYQVPDPVLAYIMRNGLYR